MKSLKTWSAVLIFLIAGNVFAQQSDSRKNERAKKRETVNKVDKAEKTVENVNETIDTTTKSIDNTIEGATETVNKVGKILFGSKEKRERAKNAVVLEIGPITYEDPNLEELYQQLAQRHGGKRTDKSFANGREKITVTIKKNASTLWEELPKTLRMRFKIQQMGDKEVLLELKNKEENE